MQRSLSLRWLLVLAFAALPACGDDDDTTGDGDADTDADGDTDGDVQWTIEDVDIDDAANQPSLDISDSGEVGISYYTIHYYQDGTIKSVEFWNDRQEVEARIDPRFLICP